MGWDILGRCQTLFLALCSEVSSGHAGEQYVMLGIEPRSRMYKTSVLSILSPWP